MAYFDSCPSCGSNDVTGNIGKATSSCKSCGFISVAGEEIPESILISSESNRTLTPFSKIQNLPSVIALPLEEYIQEHNPVLKLWHACDVVELLLRLLVIAGLADLRQKSSLTTSLLNQINPNIGEPTL